MQLNERQLVCFLLLCLGLVGCIASTQDPNWTWIQVGETSKETILKWFGEPQRDFTDPSGFGNQPPWEMWCYENGMELWFRGPVVEKFYLPKHLDPLMQNTYSVQQMLTDYGLPEIVYEYHTESTEGIGINGWLFIYPTRGYEFAISSMFVILPGKPNQPPPPTLEIARHGRWASTGVEEWLTANSEKIVRFGGTRIEEINEYFERMDPNTFFHEPIVPPE